jgi:hypothetical protein
MGYYINRQNIVDNRKDLAPGKITNRASLPTGADGYLAYLADQNDLVVGGPTLNLKPDTGLTWYKFLTKPLDYKNEVIISQGVIVGGGEVGYGDRNTIQQVQVQTDLLIKISITAPFNTAYGGNHSTYLYAYYHQGRDDSGLTVGHASFKQDWATYTITYISPRPNCNGPNLNSTQPGAKTQNTFGVLMKDSASCYVTFSNDTWTSGGYDGVATGTGWGSFGQDHGYNYGASGDLYVVNFSGGAWHATGAGGPPNGGGAGKSLNTKYGKRYNGGAAIDRYTESNNTWSVVGSSPNGNSTASWQEQQTIMGQDWGYWLGFTDVSSGSVSYSKNTYYQHYPTESFVRMTYTDISYPTTAGCTTHGP